MTSSRLQFLDESLEMFGIYPGLTGDQKLWGAVIQRAIADFVYFERVYKELQELRTTRTRKRGRRVSLEDEYTNLINFLFSDEETETNLFTICMLIFTTNESALCTLIRDKTIKLREEVLSKSIDDCTLSLMMEASSKTTKRRYFA